MRQYLYFLNPQRWSLAVRVFAVLLFTGGFALRLVDTRPWSVALHDRWTEFSYQSLTIPEVMTPLPALYPSVRVRVSPDAVDIDVRSLLATLRPELRQFVTESTDERWRDALHGATLTTLPLQHGHLRDDNQSRAKLLSLQNRYGYIRHALGTLTREDFDYRLMSSTIYFIHPSVPMATVNELCLATSAGDVGFALRGRQGIVVYEYRPRLCAPVPSVELDVHTSSFRLRTNTERGGCTIGPNRVSSTEFTITRSGSDRGMDALRRALSVAPWRYSAEHARPEPKVYPEVQARIELQFDNDHYDENPFLFLTNRGPWGEIAITVDSDITFGDYIEIVMAARERNPGDCERNNWWEHNGCFFPTITPKIRRIRPLH
jgi:hypothetical protein